MTLQQLKYFSVMAEILHYTEAAKHLYVSQSSLSYAISELEKELDAPLFEKKGKQTALSKYGEAFLPYAAQALDAVEAGNRRVAQMLQSNSIINLGYIYSLSFDYLPQAIKGFRAQPGNSAVSFQFFQGVNSALMQKLRRGELDLALSVEPGDEGICSLPVHLQDLYLVVHNTHRLAQYESVMASDMANETFVSITANSGLRKHIDDIFDSLGIARTIAFEAEECNSMASFVSAQFGIAIMPEIPSFLSYRVKAIPIADPCFRRQIYLLWSKERFSSPAVEQFREFLAKPMPSDQGLFA